MMHCIPLRQVAILAFVWCAAFPGGLASFSGAATAETRIKDIVQVRGVRANQLVGYGLVVGLNGTGDSLRNSPFTAQALKSMLDRMGLNVRGANPRARNVAGVMVTAELPPFAGKGSRIDVTVSSLGDATSLLGGSLIMTPLVGADKRIYAVAQGGLAASGAAITGNAGKVQSGVPTAARIPNGAMIERELSNNLSDNKFLVLELRNPDFQTAVLVADAINAFARTRYARLLAREQNLRTVKVIKPHNVSAARFIAQIGRLRVEPDSPARIVIDQRSGTIVIGREVTISTVAVAHGNLVVRVSEDEVVSQPLPFANGQTVVSPQTTIDVAEQGGNLDFVKGSSLKSLVSGLNRMGLKPSDIISILQAIKTAGALQADLIIQ